MFGKLFDKLKPRLAIAGIVDAAIARLGEYEFRVYHGCDSGTPYYGFRIVKRPAFIDLDGDGIADKQ